MVFTFPTSNTSHHSLPHYLLSSYFYQQRIIDGLLVAKEANLDLSQIEDIKLLKEVERLGRSLEEKEVYK